MKSKLVNKLNLFALMIGAIALTLAFAPMIPVHAQETGSPPPEHQGPFAGISLTSDQKSQIEQIHQSTHAKLDALMTAEQKTQLENARQQGQDPHQALDSLNFTDDQKAKAREILQSSRKQIDAILTPEQLQQVRQNHPPHPEGQQN